MIGHSAPVWKSCLDTKEQFILLSGEGIYILVVKGKQLFNWYTSFITPSGLKEDGRFINNLFSERINLFLFIRVLMLFHKYLMIIKMIHSKCKFFHMFVSLWKGNSCCEMIIIFPWRYLKWESVNTQNMFIYIQEWICCLKWKKNF